jgi:hypothetical protein
LAGFVPARSAESWGRALPWSIKNLMFHDKPVPLSNQRMHGYRKVWVYCSNQMAETAR